MVNAAVLDINAKVFFIDALHEGVEKAGEFGAISHFDDFACCFGCVVDGDIRAHFEQVEHVVFFELEVGSFDDGKLGCVCADGFKECGDDD